MTLEPIESLGHGLKTLAELVDEDVLEPDVRRDDWVRLASRVRLVRTTLTEQVLAPLPDALAAAEDDASRGAMTARVCELMAEVAVVLYAAHERGTASDLLRRARGLLTDSGLPTAFLQSASDHPEDFADLTHARWLRRKGREGRAKVVYQRLINGKAAATIVEAARTEIEGSRPLTSAPTLFTFNGFGTTLYGQRDVWSDGSYVATQYLCAVFIPVFPLAAYRVRQVDTNQYQFLSREPLGPAAKLWRKLAGASALIAALGFGCYEYLDSPSRKVDAAMKEAAAAESAGDREGALEQYRAVIWDHHRDTNVSAAGEAVARLSAEGLASPCDTTAVEGAHRLLASLDDLPPTVLEGPPRELVAGRLAFCADEIGDETAEQGYAALAVLDLASQASGGSQQGDGLRATYRARAKALAGALAQERPFAALSVLSTCFEDAQARASALALFDSFGTAPSLWLEAAPYVEAWIRAGGSQKERVHRALEDARKQAAEASKALEGADEKALAKLAETLPRNLEVGVALARAQRGRGDSEAAIATLKGYGPEGRLTAHAQQLLAMCMADVGQLAGAEAVLSAFVRERLSGYRRAQRAYVREATRLRTDYFDRAERGDVDADIDVQLTTVPQDQKLEVFSKWVSERLDKNPELSALREELLRDQVIVPASLGLGAVRLRRASAKSGAERDALLAEAESAFLAIRATAEGSPDYHLGLGQVYHRLGRKAEGDAELDRLLAHEDKKLHLEVADILRELGLTARAKKIVETVYETGSEEEKRLAAPQRVVLADTLEDREAWLKRCDQSNDRVKLQLLELQAQRLANQGKLVEADRMYARVAEGYERDAKHNSAAANNAALAHGQRYACTGDRAHLKKARENLQVASRLTPNSAIVLSNLGQLLEQDALVGVLGHWIHNDVLRANGGEAESLVAELVYSPLREQLLRRLGQESSFLRCMDTAEQEQILAPGNQQAYERTVRWLAWKRDVAGLQALSDRLAVLPPCDVEDAKEQRRLYEAGERDAESAKMLADLLTRSTQRLERVRRDGHGPTIAAALVLHGIVLLQQAQLEPKAETLDAIVAAAREAAKAWPEASLERDLVATLVVAGVMRAAEASEPVRQAWRERGRGLGVAEWLDTVSQGADADTLQASLRQRPELQEAALLARALPPEGDGMLTYELGRTVGDDTLTLRGAAAMRRPEVVLAAKLDAALHPGLDREMTRLAIVTRPQPPSLQ